MQHINNSTYDMITNDISVIWRIRCDLHKLNSHNQDTTKAAISRSQCTILRCKLSTCHDIWHSKLSFKYTITLAVQKKLNYLSTGTIANIHNYVHLRKPFSEFFCPVWQSWKRDNNKERPMNLLSILKEDMRRRVP